VNHSPREGYDYSVSQGSPIVSSKIASRLLLELFRARWTGLLTSNAKIHVKWLAAECAAPIGRLGRLETLQNVIPEPDGALINSQSDVSTHGDAAQVFSFYQQPAFRLERHKPAGRHPDWK
jgi:hypothetical protein